MSIESTEVHDELRQVARDLLGHNPEPAWSLLADLGWLGLEVAEELGGAGATFAEVAVILEELGRAAARTPYLGNVVLGVGALLLLESSQARDALLESIAAGTTQVAVVLPTGDDPTPTFRVEGSRLEGQAQLVPDLVQADRLLVLALDDTGTPVLVVAQGPEIAEQPVLDVSRSLGTVTASGLEVTEVWRFAGDADAAAARLRQRAAVALACDSLGVATAMLEATVAYAQVREQFNRPIGSFQAVKHACADMLVTLTIGRELLTAALAALVTDDPEVDAAASRAKSYMGSAAVDVVGQALQLHGGIGYTWEGGIHVFLKRVLLSRSLFGSPAAHRRGLARRLLALP